MLVSALAAEGKLIDTAPDGFYFLSQDTETENQSLVHACSLTESTVEAESGTVLGHPCTIVAKIDESHIEELLGEIGQSRQDISNGKSLMTIATGIGLFLVSATVTKKYKKLSPLIIGGLGAVGISLYGYASLENNKLSKSYYSELESQIRSGLIGKGNQLSISPLSSFDSNRYIVEAFTDFINRHGTPFDEMDLR